MEIMSFEDALLMQAAKFTIQRKAAPGDHVYYNGKLAVLAVDNSPKRVHTLKLIMLEGTFSGKSYTLNGKRLASIVLVPTIQDILIQMPDAKLTTIGPNVFRVETIENGIPIARNSTHSLIEILAYSWRQAQPPLTIKKIQA